MLDPFSTISFVSIWYWALTIILWTLICQRTLGVPHDMLLRAGRLPEVASRVDTLAAIGAERWTGVTRSIGAALAGILGFLLALLAGIGFGFDVEFAQAIVVLVAPMVLPGLARARLARRIHVDRLRGEEMRALLSRRRIWDQSIGILAIFAAAMVAVIQHPHVFLR